MNFLIIKKLYNLFSSFWFLSENFAANFFERCTKNWFANDNGDTLHGTYMTR